MDHDDRIAAAFIEIVIAQAVEIEKVTLEGVQMANRRQVGDHGMRHHSAFAGR